ncbi:MAG: porphobilinogen synthase [Planctomycetes bacterium]|nr:porphobilinogen synthase [Planctomycetota bacterium]MCB9888030.1 porphobilinogen synthase [Planctomycetota bacterium]
MNIRPRRLRRTAALRDLVAETTVDSRALVQPHFVLPGDRDTQPIDAMPGIARMGCEPLLQRVEADLELGIRSVLLFGVGAPKDATGSAGSDPQSPAHRAITRLKAAFGEDLTVIADVCLCTYTDHGHCGLLEGGQVANDPSLPLLARQAVSLAAAGADVIAPSDMMDGRVAAIRQGLDVDGFADRAILSYAVKYASSFYGPFREAADSAPKSVGPRDRKTYQMDWRNRDEALREAELDLAEGADILMVKPALAYLDVIARVADHTGAPIAAYLVSGEYSMIKLMAGAGMAEERELVREHLHAVRRAGARILVTYHARQALAEGWL